MPREAIFVSLGAGVESTPHRLFRRAQLLQQAPVPPQVQPAAHLAQQALAVPPSLVFAVLEHPSTPATAALAINTPMSFQ
jgi:hypothetical protein